MQKDAIYKVCGLRNSGQAYRQFHAAGFFAGAYETAIVLLGHKACGVLIAAMGAAGVVATFVGFWPS
jgi:hypothetical protein